MCGGMWVCGWAHVRGHVGERRRAHAGAGGCAAARTCGGTWVHGGAHLRRHVGDPRRAPAPPHASAGFKSPRPSSRSVPGAPPPSAFTPRERALVRRLDTPLKVQRWLEGLPYNMRETARSLRGVARARTANCLEGGIAAAGILEQHGSPPLVLSIESRDGLGHVVVLFRRSFWPGLRRGERDAWGGVARSRDPGLHGRKPVFRTVRDLVWSYYDPYVDFTGEITGYAVVDLASEVKGGDWRLAEGNVWRAESAMLRARHTPLRASRARERKWRRWYRAHMERTGGVKPDRYPGDERWL